MNQNFMVTKTQNSGTQKGTLVFITMNHDSQLVFLSIVMVTQNLLRKISVQMLYTRKCDKGPVNVSRRDEHKEVKLRLYDMLAKRISRLTHFAVTALKKKEK